MKSPGNVMCVLCGMADTVETDVDELGGIASAMSWAMHFNETHPNADPVSSYIVMMEADS